MDNLVIAVIAIAVAQALTILLSIGREREIRKLRELVNEQRLQIVKLSAWLAGRNAAQPPRIKSEPEPVPEPIADNMKALEPAITPKDLPEIIQPRTAEEEAAQAMKALNWSREIVAGLQIGLKGGAPPEPATTKVSEPAIAPKDLPDTIRSSTTEDELKRATKAFKWFKEDADEPREIVEAREIVAGLKGGAPPEPAMTRVPEPATAPKDSTDTIRPNTAEDELKRANKAINWLKEDADREREIRAILQGGKPPEKFG
jgi:hypothetical protein